MFLVSFYALDLPKKIDFAAICNGIATSACICCANRSQGSRTALF
ncbi:hypothetical protein IFVP69_C2160033 [Vibrio parahaemolyticus]